MFKQCKEIDKTATSFSYEVTCSIITLALEYRRLEDWKTEENAGALERFKNLPGALELQTKTCRTMDQSWRAEAVRKKESRTLEIRKKGQIDEALLGLDYSQHR